LHGKEEEHETSSRENGTRLEDALNSLGQPKNGRANILSWDRPRLFRRGKREVGGGKRTLIAL